MGALLWDPGRRVLYVGQLYQGLLQLRLTPTGPQLERLPLPGGDLEETPHALVVDRRGHLWAGGNHGLVHFDGERWTRFGTESGLLETSARLAGGDARGGPAGGLLERARPLALPARGGARASPSRRPPSSPATPCTRSGYDRRGVLWLGTATGVKRWDGKRLERYGRAAACRARTAPPTGCFVEPDGDVWVGMSSGLAHFHARTERPPPAPPHGGPHLGAGGPPAAHRARRRGRSRCPTRSARWSSTWPR